MSAYKRITVAKGDGIGPEIMDATLRILEAAGARLEYDVIEVGEKVYLAGNNSGITEESWDILKRNQVLLKAPITTPQGGGYKSLNVTMRKMLGMFSNVRPCRSYAPYVRTNFPNLDLVIIRENEEDLYAGIEYQYTPEVLVSLKYITRTGCEKIIRYAFEYAVANGRKKVTCMSKDNIMKQTDGLFHKVFNEVAKEYPQLETDHYIIDIGAARLAADPCRFDVIVTMNLYGDIISDIAAEVSGSVGMCGSANVGGSFAMFEAIHGSAPDISGKDLANPSGLLNAACMMLVHVGQGDIAAIIENALLKTLEDGIHTGEIYREGLSKQRVGTQGFADAVIERLGQKPSAFKTVELEASKPIHVKVGANKIKETTLVGADIYLHHGVDISMEALGAQLNAITESMAVTLGGNLQLLSITNRGLAVYPNGNSESEITDQSRCCFAINKDFPAVEQSEVIALLGKISESGLVINRVENLYFFDGVRGFSLPQGA